MFLEHQISISDIWRIIWLIAAENSALPYTQLKTVPLLHNPALQWMKKNCERKTGFVLHGSCACPSRQCPKLHELHSQADVYRQWTLLTMWGAVLGTVQPWHFAHALSRTHAVRSFRAGGGGYLGFECQRVNVYKQVWKIDDACVCVWSVKNINIPRAHSLYLFKWESAGLWRWGEEGRKSLSVNSSRRWHY